MTRVRTWETRARDLGMQLVALIIVLGAIDRWLVHLPPAPVGLATGALVGVGNVLSLASPERRVRLTAPASRPVTPSL